MHIKIFCDESNHLYTDNSNLMVLGGISCPLEKVDFINRYIKHLKHKHKVGQELKWTTNKYLVSSYIIYSNELNNFRRKLKKYNDNKPTGEEWF